MTHSLIHPIDEEYLFVSNKTGENMDELYQLIDSTLYPDSRLASLKIPFSKGNIYQQIKDSAQILETVYQEDGIFVRAILSKIQIQKLSEYLI